MPRCTTMFLMILITAATAASGEAPKPVGIEGVWRHHTLFYEFAPAGNMRIIQTDSASTQCTSFTCEQIPGEYRTLIRYGKTLADTAACSYLLIRGLEDSSCTIAPGTPFLRESGGPGIKGVWTYASKLSIMTWSFTDQSAAYRQQTLDLTTGQFVTNERHDGVFTRGKRDDTGIFHIQFSDNTTADVLPLIAGDIMYLFDLTANRSWFVREPAPPDCTNTSTKSQTGKAKDVPAKAATKR